MEYNSKIKHTLVWLGDLVFPKRCVGCHGFNEPEDLPYLCRGCMKKIPIRSTSECIGCKISSPLGETCQLCKPVWSVDRLLISSDYGHSTLSKLLKTLKFKFVQDIHLALSAILLLYIRKLASKKISPLLENSLIIPVPLFYRRFNWRGFNQSELLARALADKILLQLDTTCLNKTVATMPQTEKEDRDSRLSNVTGTFTIKYPEKILNRNILLVDDVCTTGATLNECAKVLKSAGARTITAIVVARDSYKRDS